MCLRLAFHFPFTLHHRESPGAAAEYRRLCQGETDSLRHGLLTHCPWLGQDRRCGWKVFPYVDGTEDVPLDGDEAMDMDGPAADDERSRLRPRPDVGRADSGREGFLCGGQGCDRWMRTLGEAQRAADTRPSKGGDERGPGRDRCLSALSANRSCGSLHDSPSSHQAQTKGRVEAFSPNHGRLASRRSA